MNNDGLLVRIADALDRIADALEKDNERIVTPFYPVPVYPTPDGTGDPLPNEFIVTCDASSASEGLVGTITHAEAPFTNTNEHRMED